MYVEQYGEYAYWWKGIKGIIPRSDSHITSPYNIYPLYYQVEVVILI